MSSSNKSTSINVSDIPRFTGRNFQAWKDKMVGVFMIAKVYDVIKGDTTKPDQTQRPKMPTTPPVGNVTGYPGVFQSNPCLYLSKPVPASMSTGFHRYGSWVYENPRVLQPAQGYASRNDK